MSKPNRRTMLKAGAVGAAFIPARFSIGKPGPSANSKLNIAMIGSCNIAGMAYAGCKGENIVALADVDSKMLDWAVSSAEDRKNARCFTDFREMLDKMDKEIDAVCISTPDHTHFVATIDAMRRGKHVCTQKPLTHNIWEARMLQKAKAQYGVVTNMAVQGHTFDGIRSMREWYEADVFGQINEVHSWIHGPLWEEYDGKTNKYWHKPSSLPPKQDPIPANLNWDLWLGPLAGDTPYNHLFHPKSWRGYNKFGNGIFGDWMPHIADAAVSILDLTSPTVVELEDSEGGNEWLVPDGNRVRWEFSQRGEKDPCTFYWYNGGEKFRVPTPKEWDWSGWLPWAGTIYNGEKNNAYTDERSNHPRLTNKEAMKAFKAAGYPDEKYERVEGGPFAEWVRAIKGDGPEPGANFDFSAPFTEMMLLGVLASRFGGKIEWDSKSMRITNRPELNQFLKEPIREGWDYSEYLEG
ncbi:Gfo/Idh/MocA family oxidoreductase [Pontiella agarivorans]|uniref:Gfo/Idh/MocA family oxidoreductase n=1 Tax=Pontiella agarivorans TaxID=3038953 RepID=A0ABU5MWF4_9BACT|nr:Gfo/Idh/MocA family oxidoreductase [Pontiella agarivorans]MDZ8118457.1 Gfo/Idh/MocA family oxidoreductase [Pontiella agarivorans]